MNEIQMLKAMGHLPGRRCDQLDNLGVDEESLAKYARGRRCLHPDKLDVEIANAKPASLADNLACTQEEAIGLIASHSKMAERTGDGSWPADCHPGHPGIHAVKVFLDVDTFPDQYTRPVTSAELDDVIEAGVWRWTRAELENEFAGRPMVEVAMALCNEAYRLVGVKHVMVHDGPDGDHQIHIKSVRLSGSTIGVAWFNNESCGDHVNNHIDSGWNPDLSDCARLLAHECGHNHNLEHEFAGQGSHHGVMSYDDPPSGLFYGFSTGAAPHSLPRDPSLPDLERQYGGEEIPLDEGPVVPVEPPPTDESGYYLRGVTELVRRSDGAVVGRFHFVPAEEV